MQRHKNIMKMVHFMGLISRTRRTKNELINIMYSEYKYDVSGRTFDRMLRDVRDLGYNVIVDKKHQYYLERDSTDIEYKVLIQINSILTRKALLNKIGPNINSNLIIQNYLDNGVYNVATIMEAFNEERDLIFDYTNRSSIKSFSRCVLPFYLMETEYRWYLISWDYKKQELAVFSLDKMENPICGDKVNKTRVPIEIINKVNSYQNRIGVNLPLFKEEPYRVYTITIAVSKDYKPFIKKMPLHKSQKFTEEKINEYQVFTIDVIPDYTLINKISAELGSLKLVGPSELKERVLQEYPWFEAFVI